MARVYVPSRGTKDWKRVYNNPGTQWERGNAGRALAHCWERADGLPDEVQSLFRGSGIGSLQRLQPLITFLDYDVEVPSGWSHHDLFTLARDSSGQLVSIAVLGKVLAPFGPSIGQRQGEGTNGGQGDADGDVWLRFVLDQLELTAPVPDNVPFVLLHHAALAVTSAQRFSAPTAVLIIHAFGQKADWTSEYEDFLRVFHARRTLNGLHLLRHTRGIALYCGWAAGDKKYLRK
jgi:hypothetical protein